MAYYTKYDFTKGPIVLAYFTKFTKFHDDIMTTHKIEYLYH